MDQGSWSCPHRAAAYAGALADYRSGAPVSAIAAALDVSFDAVARLVVASGIRRDVLPAGPLPSDPPEQLDDPDRVGAFPGARAIADIESERGELVERFRIAAERAHSARASLDGALAVQASAVSGLTGTGLTVPAVADRLGVPDMTVLELLDGPPQSSAACAPATRRLPSTGEEEVSP